MSLKLYEENDVQNIADAIREKGVEGSFKVSDMADAIGRISTKDSLLDRFENRYITIKNTIDWNTDWELQIAFQPYSSLKGALCGTLNDSRYYWNPSIEIQNGNLWIGLSSNGSSWTFSKTYPVTWDTSSKYIINMKRLNKITTINLYKVVDSNLELVFTDTTNLETIYSSSNTFIIGGNANNNNLWFAGRIMLDNLICKNI